MSYTSLLAYRNRTTLVDYLHMKGVVLFKARQTLTPEEVRKMLEMASSLPPATTDSRHSQSPVAVPSVSQLAAAQPLMVEEEEPAFVTEAEMRWFLRRMAAVELPNSSLKKKPKLAPPPEPTFHERLHAKVLDSMRIFEEPPKPPPPPRKPRPEPEVAESEAQKKKKKKKKKGGKKRKGKAGGEEAPVFNIHDWRKENLPVASTLLFPRDPPPSPGPLPQLSPPLPVPEPKSFFTHFLEGIQPDVRQY